MHVAVLLLVPFGERQRRCTCPWGDLDEFQPQIFDEWRRGKEPFNFGPISTAEVDMSSRHDKQRLRPLAGRTREVGNSVAS